MFDGDNDEDSSDSSSEEYSEKDRKDDSRKRRHKEKKSKERLTWAEAAEIVLSKHDQPLQHKEILKLIEESKLKSMGRGSSAPLAVLNSMLNTHSRGPSATFYRASSGSACFGLTRNRIKNKNSSSSETTHSTETESKSTKAESERLTPSKSEIVKAKTYAEFKKENRTKQKLTPPTKYNLPVRQLNPPGQLAKFSSNSSQKQRLIPPGYDTKNCSSPTLGTMSKATYDRLKQQPQHRRMGPTTAALVRPAPPFSRPPPGAALRVMPPKKRVKLDEDDEDTGASEKSVTVDSKKEEEKNSRLIKVEETTRRESQRNQLRSQQQAKHLAQVAAAKKQLQQQRQLQQQQRAMERNKQKLISKQNRVVTRPTISRSSSRNNLPSKSPQMMMYKKNAPIPVTTTNNATEQQENSKQHSFLGVKFKKLKKANLADQIKRSKEGKLDLMSPDSILTSVHIKDLLSEGTFKLLPPAYQYQLLMLLPECDRQIGNDGAVKLSKYSMNNAFFTRACQEFKDKLMDGEFNSDIIQRAKNEVQLNTRLDSWKVKFFEPVYGKSSLDDDDDDENEKPPPNLKPVESSWVTFLKFSENSTDDFEEALAKIQLEVQKIAEKDAKKQQELDKKKREAISSRIIIKTRKLSPGVSNIRSSPTMRSPVLLKSKTIRTEVGNKEKSRRALKKAQSLQRKKAFDKQLKDAKAKIVQDARSGSRKDEETISANDNDYIERLPNSSQYASDFTVKPLNILCSPPLSSYTVNDTDTFSADKKESPKDKENASTVINLCDSMTLKNLIKSSEMTKPVKKPPAKRKTMASKALTSSRIVYGPSTFGTNAEGNCPCNLKAMVLCKQCGSFWHGDCVNGERICVLCTS